MAAHRGDRQAPALQRARRYLSTGLALAGAAAWFVLLGPSTLGGPTTLVQVTGESMEPGMHTGDLAVVRRADSYDVDDVVAFRVPMEDGSRGPVVIHRVLDRVDGAMTLRGDNNDWNDPWPVTDDDVVGELWLHVPDVGTWVGAVATPVNLAALAAAGMAFMVMTGGKPDGDSDSDIDSEPGHPADDAPVVDLREPGPVTNVSSAATALQRQARPGETLTVQEWLLVVGGRP